MTSTMNSTEAPDVWLPIEVDGIEGLPEGLNYRFWNGGQDYPADPADCAFYVVPYMKGPEVAVHPLSGMSSVRVVQTLSRASTMSSRGSACCPPVCGCATPRGSTKRPPPS